MSKWSDKTTASCVNMNWHVMAGLLFVFGKKLVHLRHKSIISSHQHHSSSWYSTDPLNVLVVAGVGRSCGPNSARWQFYINMAQRHIPRITNTPMVFSSTYSMALSGDMQYLVDSSLSNTSNQLPSPKNVKSVPEAPTPGPI